MKPSLENHEVRIQGVEKRVDTLETCYASLMATLNGINTEVTKWGTGLKVTLTILGAMGTVILLLHAVLQIGQVLGWL